LRHLFLGEASPGCAETADTDNDGTLALTDAVSLLDFLFRGGPGPATPGPTTEPCGIDPDPPGSAADIGCEVYPGCGA